MKKTIAVLSALMLSAAMFTGCGDKFVPAPEDDESSSVETSTVTTTAPAQTTTVATTTTQVTTTAPAVAPSGSLSDNLYDYQISIDNDVLTLPMTYKDFVARGWKLDDESYANETLKPNYRMSTIVFKKGDLKVYAGIANLGEDTLPLTECIVTRINAEQYYLKDTTSTVMVAKGVQIGKSTMDDVKTAFGEPGKDSNTDSSPYYFVYQEDSKDYYTRVKFSFDDNKLLDEIDMEHLAKVEGMTVSNNSNSGGESAKKYKEPSELGSDISAAIINLDGKLYQVPAPLSEFKKNGWEVESDVNEVASGNTEYITLKKGDQKMSVVGLKNYDTSKTTLDNCFVTKLEVGIHSCDVPANLPKGIKVGMTEDELKKALEGTKSESKKSGDSYEYYSVSCGDSVLDRVSFTVDLKEKKVITISIDNQPREYTGK